MTPAAWPGRNVGIRAPAPGETPLSNAEVLHAARKGMLSATSWQLAELDTDPPVRRRVGAGSWRPMQGPKAEPFDGLTGF